MSFYPHVCEKCGAYAEIWRRPHTLESPVPCTGCTRRGTLPCGGPMFLNRQDVKRGSVAEEMLLARELARARETQED